MSSKISRIWNWIRRYKYLFVTGIFILVIGLFDENSFWNRYDTKKQISEIRQEIRYYTEMYQAVVDNAENNQFFERYKKILNKVFEM